MKYIPYIIGIVVISAIIFVSVGISSQQVSHSHHSASGMGMGMMGDNIVVHIASGDPTDARHMLSAEMGARMALAMQQNGKDVIVFLDSYGTLLAPEQPKSAKLKMINTMLQEFTNTGGRVIVCPHCYLELGNKIEDLTPGFEIGNPEKMAKVLSGRAIVIDY